MISRENQAIGAASLLPATILRVGEVFSQVCSPPLGASPIIIQHMLSLISAQISSSDLPTIPVQDGPLSITRESPGRSSPTKRRSVTR
jgi:hypothetical protein